MIQNSLIITGAREHNLKNLSLTLPRDKLIVFTGVSGSGKSSLAFDTIYAEGQRRYVESLSAYARQFLGQMEKPDVDSIEGLSPAISIDQKGISKNPRSTVGTITEIYDYLRLLWARAGKLHCPNCNKEITSQTIDNIVDRLLQKEGLLLTVSAPLIKNRKGEHQNLLDLAKKAGYSKIRIDNTIYDLDDAPKLDKKFKHSLEIIVDRIEISPDSRSRLSDSIEQAAKLASGNIQIDSQDSPPENFSLNFACPDCGISIEEPQPRNFSFNSPHGACSTCTGLGFKLEIDPDSLAQDPTLSIRDGALTAVLKGAYKAWILNDLLGLARRLNISTRVPWGTLTKEQQYDLLYYQSPQGRNDYRGVILTLQDRYRYTEAPAIKEELEKLMGKNPCPDCKGLRLKKEYLAVTVNGESIAAFTSRSVVSALTHLQTLTLSKRDKIVSRQILKELMERLTFLHNVGLDYLTLDRPAATLSGGEGQRIRLATQIGSRLMGVLYILDEPSIGLHQKDNHKLIETLKALRDLGNTLIVVEHDEDTIRTADFVVDIGPGAGIQGGKLIAAGPLDTILKTKESLTGAYLRGDMAIEVPKTRRPGNGLKLILYGAKENNLKNLTVPFPLGTFIAVTGVSGSGKSTLINDVLAKALAQKLHRSHEKPGQFSSLEGLENLDKVIVIDQSPIGRTPRSNPATYVGLFTDIRELYSLLPEAKVRGYRPGRFSFNVRGGRCEACAGDGQIKIEMHFLPDIYIQCEACKGRRYNKEAQEVLFKNTSIADVLRLTVKEALSLFKNQPKISRKLQTLSDVGLDYIELGQPATQLSGGEAQRVKLATELSRRSTGKTLYILDEPTTGLHFADVEKLLAVLHRLVGQGNTAIVIEHNLDVVKTADWLIDLGPEGGDAGGELIAQGTPEEILENPLSSTGHYLAHLLNKSKSLVSQI